MEEVTLLISVFLMASAMGLITSKKIESKDSTGLVGTSPLVLLGSTQLPLEFWANPKKSPIKPRKRDLHEPTLLALLGNDFDTRWMRQTRPSWSTEVENNVNRKSVQALRALLNNENSTIYGDFNNALPLQLPPELPEQYKEVVKNWLVKRATCPIRFIWDNLGPYFWPRFIRRGECVKDFAHCSWPPGMSCVPGGAKNLYVLRWHCRLRRHKGKSKKDLKIWSRTNGTYTAQEMANLRRRKKRLKYRCFWIKVPYPVPEDCICRCAQKELDSDDVYPMEDDS